MIMTLDVIALGYASIGVLIAIGAACAGRRPGATDVLMLTTVWPLAAPMLLFGDRGHAGDRELIAALARASSSPLASILPDAETARVLQARMREAAERLDDLEDVLARPDFDPAAAEQRARDLTARGATAAAATAQLRVRTLGQLRALRERYRLELEEVRELIAQLVTQAELVRLQPAIAQASGELVRELVDRVEGLGDLFAYQASLEYEPTPDRST
jgi:hypothetical protein